MRISIEGVVSQLMNQGFKSAVGRRRGADLTPKCKGSNPLHLQRVTYEVAQNRAVPRRFADMSWSVRNLAMEAPYVPGQAARAASTALQ